MASSPVHVRFDAILASDQCVTTDTPITDGSMSEMTSCTAGTGRVSGVLMKSWANTECAGEPKSTHNVTATEAACIAQGKAGITVRADGEWLLLVSTMLNVNY